MDSSRAKAKIKVLVVEDVAVARDLLVHLLSEDPAIEVIGTATNGREAVESVQRLKPDIVTMDVHMPSMNGFDATRRIMETHPVPIVIVSASFDGHDVAMSFRAVEAGALAIMERPPGFGHPEHETLAQKLVQTVKLMSEVKVVRRWARAANQPAKPSTTLPVERVSRPRPFAIDLVAIGASTGGPVVIQTILAALPGHFSPSILIVQHMSAGFIPGFAEWLAQSSRLSVRVAENGEQLRPGHAYIAPDGLQMKVQREGRIVLRDDAPEHGMRPSASYLFRAVAEEFGPRAVGVLLTGMGRDGAQELKTMRDKGAVTLVQDKETSVVHGMPGEAIRLGAAVYVLPPEKIAAMLVQLAEEGASSIHNPT